MRDISKALKKNPSSISRELKENSVKGVYDPFKAQHKAYVKRLYSKYQGMKIRAYDWLEDYIQDKLKAGWTPVDRKSLYFLAKKISRLRETISAFSKLLNQFNPLSLTLDNGVENARYDILNVPTYFCHPYSAWEKPLIENNFQRLRRYIPKKAKLSDYSDKQISDIINKMNNTPRKCLGFRTPKEVFFQEQVPTIKLPIFNFERCT